VVPGGIGGGIGAAAAAAGGREGEDSHGDAEVERRLSKLAAQ
jgi:hypothetical protein